MPNCVAEDYSVEKKTSVKHDFQNNFLRFDMYKIAMHSSKKIVGSVQLLVIGYWFLMHKRNEAMQYCFETQTTSSNSNR